MCAVIDIQNFVLKRRRVSLADRRRDLQCEWCKEVSETTVGEVWSNYDPAGWLVRLCYSCASHCAEG